VREGDLKCHGYAKYLHEESLLQKLYFVWGIVYLNDPDSYAGWSFYTPGWTSQARQVEG